MKRVLVTGACGNIGANVVELLVERGYSVRAVDLDTPGGRAAAARWGDRVEMRFGSICNEALVRDVVTGTDHVNYPVFVLPVVETFDRKIEIEGLVHVGNPSV